MQRPAIRPYLSLRAVPDRFGPCYLWRTPLSVLIAVAPGTPRTALLEFLVTRATLTEQNAFRWYVGQGPVGTPLPDWMLEGPVRTVPPGLRLPGEKLGCGLDSDWPSVDMAS